MDQVQPDEQQRRKILKWFTPMPIFNFSLRHSIPFLLPGLRGWRTGAECFRAGFYAGESRMKIRHNVWRDQFQWFTYETIVSTFSPFWTTIGKTDKFMGLASCSTVCNYSAITILWHVRWIYSSVDIPIGKWGKYHNSLHHNYISKNKELMPQWIINA